ncbi:hypothetical protein RHMOL_Rhmol06G0141600 [Rhododendron molle]|uniref:Uncharacterized protein n=1 Tax=Rhododendron molle TaxID=49168 RepID=A0ACC0NC24_RHOML|nr:hypothetical protein RHMOL_Rhmol06G0141600 [Rhododendron molle]
MRQRTGGPPLPPPINLVSSEIKGTSTTFSRQLCSIPLGPNLMTQRPPIMAEDNLHPTRWADLLLLLQSI